jgi:hypothetical protein
MTESKGPLKGCTDSDADECWVLRTHSLGSRFAAEPYVRAGNII